MKTEVTIVFTHDERTAKKVIREYTERMLDPRGEELKGVHNAFEDSIDSVRVKHVGDTK